MRIEFSMTAPKHPNVDKILENAMLSDGLHAGWLRRTLLLCAVALVFLFRSAGPSPASAQDIVRIQNYWSQSQFINIEYGKAVAGQIEPGWWSAMWAIEATDDGRIRLRNRWKPNEYLHIESGQIESGPIQPTWGSATWRFDSVQGFAGIRIQNGWKPDQYLHVQYGQLAIGPIQGNWSSALWLIHYVQQ